MQKSIEARLQKLESTHSDAGIVIMSCRHGGTHEGAKAFFQEVMGCPVKQRGGLVLERPGRGAPIEEAELGAPLYEIQAIVSGAELSQLIRDVNGKTRGLPVTRDVQSA